MRVARQHGMRRGALPRPRLSRIFGAVAPQFSQQLLLIAVAQGVRCTNIAGFVLIRGYQPGVPSGLDALPHPVRQAGPGHNAIPHKL